MYQLYTDGSSTGKSNREGGWAYILLKDDKVIYSKFGGAPKTTNNLMESMAAIEGLSYCLENNYIPVELRSDSMYVLGIANGDYSPKKNLEEASLLRKLAKHLKIYVKWVKGHGKDEWNRIADTLAKMGKDKYSRKKK